MPAENDREKAQKIIRRRHPEYLASVQTTRWILDTLVSGDAYKDAEYGFDRRGKPLRNLFRHKREYPGIPGMPTDEDGNPLPFHLSGSIDRDHIETIEFDYELRRQRTPVPNFLGTYIEQQLSKIFKRPVVREGPDVLLAWDDDIDGRDTTIGEWMHDTVAPLLCALGMIDVGFQHPEREAGEPVLFGDKLDDANGRCIAYHILPENVLWWKLDYTRRNYTELLIREFHEMINDAGRTVEIERFRHWTPEDWTLYEADGSVVQNQEHPFGIIPVVRLFDRRNLRMDHVSNSRMYGVVDKSRAYYNEESEIVANNTMHSCPILQGPEEQYGGPEDQRAQSVPVDRHYMLHKVQDQNGQWVGYDYLSPPTETSAFMRERLADLQERMEREVALTRPVGSSTRGAGGTKGMVAQSGISKAYDQQEGSEYLASVSKTIEIAEYTIRYFALIILMDGWENVKKNDIDKINVTYPREFNLLSFDQYAVIVETMQAYIAGGLGRIPTDEKETLKHFVRLKFPDMGTDNLAEIDTQIDTLVDEAVKSRKTKPAPADNTPVLPIPGIPGPAQPPPVPLRAGTNGVPAPVPIDRTGAPRLPVDVSGGDPVSSDRYGGNPSVQ